jgi:[ribosomal protein S5]-alanine N-acetyltransferase
VLTHPSPADADEFIAAAIDSAPLHGSFLSAPDTAERFTAFLNRAAREDQASYLIRHTACGSLVGYVNINNIVRGALRSGYLGYAAFRSHAGRGLMTAGLAAVVTDGFASLGLHRLEANIQPDNARSLLAPVPAHRRRVARPRTVGDGRRRVGRSRPRVRSA